MSKRNAQLDASPGLSGEIGTVDPSVDAVKTELLQFIATHRAGVPRSVSIPSAADLARFSSTTLTIIKARLTTALETSAAVAEDSDLTRPHKMGMLSSVCMY